MQFPSSMKEFLSLSIYPREADSETCWLISLWSLTRVEEVLYYHIIVYAHCKLLQCMPICWPGVLIIIPGISRARPPQPTRPITHDPSNQPTSLLLMLRCSKPILSRFGPSQGLEWRRHFSTYVDHKPSTYADFQDKLWKYGGVLWCVVIQ
jgi:hypothetical protein